MTNNIDPATVAFHNPTTPPVIPTPPLSVEEVKAQLWNIGLGVTLGKGVQSQVNALKALLEDLKAPNPFASDISIPERLELLKRLMSLDDLAGVYKSLTKEQKEEFLKKIA